MSEMYLTRRQQSGTNVLPGMTTLPGLYGRPCSLESGYERTASYETGWFHYWLVKDDGVYAVVETNQGQISHYLVNRFGPRPQDGAVEHRFQFTDRKWGKIVE